MCEGVFDDTVSLMESVVSILSSAAGQQMNTGAEAQSEVYTAISVHVHVRTYGSR